MQKPIITVVGSFAVGMTLRTARMPIFGETLIGSDFDMGPGGKGSNQAVGTARLGAEAHFVGIIGDDKLGEIATELYLQEGVNTRYLKKTTEMATGVGFIILDLVGHNGIILDMSANKLVDAAFVGAAEAQIAASQAVMAVLEVPVDAAAEAMRLGRKHGVMTVLNPAPAAPLSDDIIANVDVLTPNETELRILMGLAPDDPTPTRELAKQLQQRGAKTIIVTMGEHGSLILTPDMESMVPAVLVDVVDTTGAGDAYNSGLAVALAEGKDIVTAAQYAACAGALACTRLGVIPGLPQRQAVEDLYQKHFG
ncbi:MAG: ribokinase [Chloroflexota bacterium]